MSERTRDFLALCSYIGGGSLIVGGVYTEFGDGWALIIAGVITVALALLLSATE